MSARGTALRIFIPIYVGAGVSFFGFMPLLGIPGAFLAELAALLFGLSDRLRDLGPSAWGLAIFVTWCAGAGVPLGCWLLWRLLPRAKVWAWIAAGAAGYVIVGGAAAVWLILTSAPERGM